MKGTKARSRGNSAAGPPSIVAAVGAVVLLAALYFLRDIFIPLALAITLTFLMTPVVAWLERLRLGRVGSVVLTLAVAASIALSGGWIIANQLADVAKQLPQYRDNIRSKIRAVQWQGSGPLAAATESLQELDRDLSAASDPAEGTVGGTAARGARAEAARVEIVPPAESPILHMRKVASSALRPLGFIGIVFIFTVFMLIEREDVINRLLLLAGISQLNVMTEALDDAAQRVSRYLLIQLLVNLSFGALIGGGLYFIGVPNAILWGLVAAILRIVPYAGAPLAGAMPLLLSIAVFNSWVQPLLVFALFAALELIAGNFIEPWLYGTHTGISSLALLVSAVFWTFLWGPVGLVLSTPLTVCVVVLGRYVPQLSFLHVLLGDEPSLSPEALLYQRLLARDWPEARAVVENSLKTRSLAEFYDRVFMPALSMAEQDRHRGAIDSSREEFLFQRMNEMVAEFSESAPLHPVAKVSSRMNSEELLASRRRIRVICIPAHDEADEITAAALAQCLEQLGYFSLAFPKGSSLLDIATMDPGATDVVCVSALPPYAFAFAQTLCAQVRARFPQVALFACIWGFAGDMNKASAKMERAQPQQLVTSVAEAIERLDELSSSLAALV